MSELISLEEAMKREEEEESMPQVRGAPIVSAKIKEEDIKPKPKRGRPPKSKQHEDVSAIIAEQLAPLVPVCRVSEPTHGGDKDAALKAMKEKRAAEQPPQANYMEHLVDLLAQQHPFDLLVMGALLGIMGYRAIKYLCARWSAAAPEAPLPEVPLE